MVQRLIKPGAAKELSKSDIVFCIDISGSMEPCIDGVKQNIAHFVEIIEKDPEVRINWRLGFLAHHLGAFGGITFRKRDFTKDVGEFMSALDALETGSDEANLPALDWCLDFDWRPEAHKFVVMFTDEPVDGGWDSSASRKGLPMLMDKIRNLGVSVYIASFDLQDFSDYKKIGTVDKCDFVAVGGDGDYSSISFVELMNKLGKTISTGSRGMVGSQKIVHKDIYKVKPIVKLEYV